MQVYDREFNEGLACRIIHSVEYQDYGDTGKAVICYWIQVQLPEGPIISLYSGAGRTTLGILYLSRYTDQFYNVSILPVDRHLLMSKCFGSVNEVDSHNKSCLLYLALDKYWVTQFGRLQLCTTVAMGATITNGWKLFCYGVKRDHCEKFIGIR